MFKAPALVLAALCFMASPALAQYNAPISQGVTSTDLAQQVAQARQQSAGLRVEVNGLTGDVMQLTGRVETLEFQLQQARDENEQLQQDNETLITEIDELRAQLDRQSATLGALESYLSAAGIMPESATQDEDGFDLPDATGAEPYPSASSQANSQSASGPRQLTVTSPSGTSGPTQITANGTGPDAQSLPEGSLGTIPASALPGEAGPLFAMAKSRLIQFDYAGAEEAFRAFLDRFGDDPQAGEAQYWLGESLYQQKAYADSGAAYTTMIRSYPDNPRAPDALVKLARAMRLIGDKDKACIALNTLPSRYPQASGVTRDLAAVERTKSGCDG